jgi:hypothetical protein
MIGLRRAAPGRQGDPIAHAPPRAMSAGRFNVKYKNLHTALLAEDQRKVCLLNFLPGVMVVRYQHICHQAIL